MPTRSRPPAPPRRTPEHQQHVLALRRSNAARPHGTRRPRATTRRIALRDQGQE